MQFVYDNFSRGCANILQIDQSLSYVPNYFDFVLKQIVGCTKYLSTNRRYVALMLSIGHLYNIHSHFSMLLYVLNSIVQFQAFNLNS